MNLRQLLDLRGAPLADVCARLGADPARRDADVGYEALTDVELLVDSDAPRVFVRGDAVVLVHVSRPALPDGVTSDEVAAAVGSDGELLRSRQGRTARLHVAAPAGAAWSEDAGQVAFLELFPPCALDAYRSEIYLDPGPFRR